MKNLLIHINPKQCFTGEDKIAIRIQIDNSLDLGWKKKDIMLITNFDYEHKGVRALVVGEHNFNPAFIAATKIYVILDLFNRDLIKKDEIYWYHDLDAYQLNPITESELELATCDMLVSTYGRMPRWTAASFFFKDSSKDIFHWIREIMAKHGIDEEFSLWALTGHDCHGFNSRRVIKGYTSSDLPGIENINERVRMANISYCFNSWNIRSNYRLALKPIRVAHFHFIELPKHRSNGKPDQIDFFLRGKNKLDVQIVPQRLVKIFNCYGIK